MDRAQLDNVTPRFRCIVLWPHGYIILDKLNKGPGEGPLGQFAGIWHRVGSANIVEKELVKIPVCFSAFFRAPALAGRHKAGVCSRPRCGSSLLAGVEGH